MRFSPDGTRLVASQGNCLAVYDARTGKRLLADATTRDSGLMSVALSSDGKYAALGYQDGVQLYDATTGRIVHSFSLGESSRPFHATANAVALAFTPNGKTLIAVGNRDAPETYHLGLIKSWDVESGKDVGEIIVGQEARAMALSPDGTKCFVATRGAGSAKSELLIYDLSSRKQLALLDGRNGLDSLQAACFSPEGRYVQVALSNGSYFHWDTLSGACDREFIADWRDEEQRQKEPRLWIGSAVFNSDGSRLIASTNEILAVWDTEKGTLQRRQSFKDVAHGFRLSISPDDKSLVGVQVGYSGDPGNDTVRIWDANNGKERLLLKPKGARASAVAFSSDCSKLLTGFYRGTAMLWDIH